MTQSQHVAIVGAGIVGLAHAWSAARRGHRVTLFERNWQACDASIRNFGMIWPIGQPPGEFHQLALYGRDRWLELQRTAGIWVEPCGSIHLAHRDDELAVLEEFHRKAEGLGFTTSWLTPEEVLRHSPAANPQGLRGGLYSPSELCINPPQAIRQIPAWLAREFHVRCEFSTTITHVAQGNLRSSDGRQWDFDRAVICSGADLATLFPDVLCQSGLRPCKLQMLKTKVQANRWRLGAHLAGGLTLRHYRNFEVCDSLAALKQRIAGETPELDRFGIHVMAAQNDAGEVVLGDSHEYESEIEPFDKAIIDDLMLRELNRIIRLPDWTIQQRWHGIYAKHPTQPSFEVEPLPDVHICTGLGGGGMTMSFGIAERFWQRVGSGITTEP